MTTSQGERMLQETLGTRPRAERFYRRQMLDHLNEPMREFIGRQRMMFLATSDGNGACDSTLRSGPPGFVTVLDAHRLAWPEYRGNGVLASRGNILENPHAGLLFVDFLDEVIGLHVNGRASLASALPDVAATPGRRVEQWVVVEVEEAYIHCAKNIPHLQPVTDRPRPLSRRSDFFSVARARPAVPAPRARRAALHLLLRQLWRHR
ncbi:pyridoxamine 5'-phosphate oxidase family protein [Actinoplanes sp. NBC_00393]|uniref:pyridoxamine 5'-phosphate oxidase family protein n=1 Tax=Actinoplanes sp. NBC_00393 TaxID=2975953 RepID=UPI002E23296C